VYSLAGGIKAWEGNKAAGPEEAGLELFTGNEEFADGVSLAYAMEDGLQQFYSTLADEAALGELKKLYQRLARFEVKHKARLEEEYQARLKGGASQKLAETTSSGVMEGGRNIADFLRQIQGDLNNMTDVLELAMMLETQALDLYSRMAQKSSVGSTRDLFLRLADEEKMHLGFLAEEMDNIL